LAIAEASRGPLPGTGCIFLPVAAPVVVLESKVPRDILLGVRSELRVRGKNIPLLEPVQVVMNLTEPSPRTVSGAAPPHDLVQEARPTEQVLENRPNIVVYAPVAMDEDRAAFAEEFSHQSESLVEHVDVRVSALAPRVAVRDHLKR